MKVCGILQIQANGWLLRVPGQQALLRGSSQADGHKTVQGGVPKARAHREGDEAPAPALEFCSEAAGEEGIAYHDKDPEEHNAENQTPAD